MPSGMPSTGFAPTAIVDPGLTSAGQPGGATDKQETQPPPKKTKTLFIGKVAIVTGSESGIGRETARELARQGACVMLNGLDSNRLTDTLETFHGEGLQASAWMADVTDYAACEELVEQTIRVFGRVDILITNASISMRAYFADTTVDTFKRVLDSNVYGSVYPLKAALPHLTLSEGSVTFISSISAFNGIPSGSAYCAGKAAMVNLAHTLRLELGHTGVHFGVVHLGFTRNDPDKKMLNGRGEPELLAPRPERFKLTQTEVARGILQHIRNRRNTSVLSGFGKFMWFMTKYLPTLSDTIIRWTMRRFKHMYD